MSLDGFIEAVGRLGVTTVREGTLDDQAELLNAPGDGVGDVLRNDIHEHNFPWSPWSPGSSSPTYASILAGIQDFARAVGGLPPFEEILFFEFPIEPLMLEGHLRVKRGQAAAEFANRQLLVYKNTELQARDKIIPVQKDRPGHPSPAPRPSQDVGVRRIVAHELGHGLPQLAFERARDAGRANRLLVEEYKAHVGWVGRGEAARLYDIGVSEAEQAIGRGEAPDPRFEITADHWNKGWVEQPVSRYSVQGGPGEDFAEAAMTYVEQPRALQARSGRRYDFVRSVAAELFPSEEETEQPAEAGAGQAGAR